ncbi:MAG: hypothetical protein HKO93_04370 [Flavobacteriales bacterium]|nr:hypothetical protein [Flavobacteriales bacterium]
MSVARVQRLFVLIFILAVFGIGLNQFKDKKTADDATEASQSISNDKAQVNHDYYLNK